MFQYTYIITLDDKTDVRIRTLHQNRFEGMMDCIRKVEAEQTSKFNQICKVELEKVELLGANH